MDGTDATPNLRVLDQQRSARPWIGHLVRTFGGLTLAYVIAHVAVRFFTGDPVTTTTFALEMPVFLLAALIGLVFTTAAPITQHIAEIHSQIATSDAEREREAVAQQYLRDVNEAFEMVETELDLFDIAGVALGELAHDDLGGSEILVADSSGAHVSQSVVGSVGCAPGCGVSSPGACPAVRRGQTLRFADPNALAACPQLRRRGLPDGTGATCVPVTVLGTPSAVLHSTYSYIEDDHEYEKLVTSFEGVALRFGARLGLLRAMAKSQLQADTDPLTGLLNRRAMENRVRELQAEGRRCAIAMLDLDQFKRLNDTFGHDTGDRALRTFSRVLVETMSEDDTIARYGGEEFVVVVADADVATAAPLFHLLRDRLAAEIGAAQIPPFTVSIGLCDSTWSDDLQKLVKSADRALMRAKHQGRDQLVIDNPADQDVLEPTPLGQLPLR